MITETPMLMFYVSLCYLHIITRVCSLLSKGLFAEFDFCTGLRQVPQSRTCVIRTIVKHE